MFLPFDNTWIVNIAHKPKCVFVQCAYDADVMLFVLILHIFFYISKRNLRIIDKYLFNGKSESIPGEKNREEKSAYVGAVLRF